MTVASAARTVGIVGRCHHPVARIVLDQIFERDGQLAVVLDNEDIEHSRPPPDALEIPEESVTCIVARNVPRANPP